MITVISSSGTICFFFLVLGPFQNHAESTETVLGRWGQRWQKANGTGACKCVPWGDKPPKPSLVSAQAAQGVTVPSVFVQKLRVTWGRTGSRASGSSGAVGQFSCATQGQRICLTECGENPTHQFQQSTELNKHDLVVLSSFA